MSYRQLTLEEKFIIDIFCKAKIPIREIAYNLNRHKSTIYRELKRNKGQRRYRHKQADYLSLERRYFSFKKIKEDLSPEQLSTPK